MLAGATGLKTLYQPADRPPVGQSPYGLVFSAFASTVANSFWKSARPRRASKSGSFSSLGKAQPLLTMAARVATDWSANAFASSFVTPDFASPPSPASSACVRNRST